MHHSRVKTNEISYQPHDRREEVVVTSMEDQLNLSHILILLLALVINVSV